MRWFVFVVGALGCGNPIEACDEGTFTSDCCETDDQCAAFYGASWSRCLHPEDAPAGGICGECATDRDCHNGRVCVETNAHGLTQCLHPDQCQTWTTSGTTYYFGACR